MTSLRGFPGLKMPKAVREEKATPAKTGTLLPAAIIPSPAGSGRLIPPDQSRRQEALRELVSPIFKARKNLASI